MNISILPVIDKEAHQGMVLDFTCLQLISNISPEHEDKMNLVQGSDFITKSGKGSM